MRPKQSANGIAESGIACGLREHDCPGNDLAAGVLFTVAMLPPRLIELTTGGKLIGRRVRNGENRHEVRRVYLKKETDAKPE